MSASATLRQGRLTIRMRLTLLYGGMILASGIVLLAILYVLMRYVPDYRLAPTRSVRADPSPGVPVDHAETVSRGVPYSPLTASVTTEHDVLTTLLQLSGAALVVMTLVAFLLGWIIAGRILAPIHRMTRAARTIAGSTLHERIRLDGRQDEFTDLADTIDTMLDRLHASFHAQQRFAANAAHELRTPLATTRTMLQVARAHPDDHDTATLATKLMTTNERSITTVESLLTLARADHGIDDAQPVDLAAVADKALDQVWEEAEARGISISTHLRSVTIDGDRDLLHHLLTNLLHNAIRHNHDGGTVRLAVTAEDSTAVVTTTNSGEIIPADLADRLFEPFHRQRGRTRSAGHGLGLTLVRAIAHSHHGTADGTPNPEGGLTTRIALPVSGRSGHRVEGGAAAAPPQPVLS